PERAAMQRALDLARRGWGRVAPNPLVGAVVLAGDRIVGEGYHAEYGGPHAEVVALEAAGARARGATLVVTLEPCAHHGRTPPCVEAIIEAGIARVVIGVEDPDPNVSGKGIAALREAGIDVEVGVLAEEVAAQLAPYLKHRTTGRPWLVLKLAASVDGRTAAPDGSSEWITGDEARTDAHRLRAESDAVIIGAGTVRADDPSLTVRHVEGRDPLRVVLGTAPAEAKVHPAVEPEG